MTFLRRMARDAWSIEFLVGVAVALTLFAVAFREPLTRQVVQFGPDQVGKTFYAYAYDDHQNGGRSQLTYDESRPLRWTCDLKPDFEWPYCGFGMQLDTSNSGHGIDLTGYERINLYLDHKGSGSLIRVALKDHDPRFQKLGTGQDKVDEANFPVHDGKQVVPLTLSDFSVAEWWKNASKAPAPLARPGFGNIVSLEIISGADEELGPQTFSIDRVTFERHIVSAETWYGGIALCWMILGGCLLLGRRKQLGKLRQKAEAAVRESERRYRGILETSTDTILLLNPEGYVELVNGPGVAAMEFDSAKRVLGRHWSQLWRHESAAVVGDALTRAENGDVARFRAFCTTARGTPKWWDVIVAPMWRDDGSLEALLTISRDVTQERERSDQLRWASEHDPLTHLPNRRAFQARLQAATLRAMEGEGQLGLLLVDLDHFKHVNDTLGHGAGDQLLGAMAQRLRNGVREGDFVARIGGDEFAIVLENVESEEVLSSVGAAVLSRIQMPVLIGNRSVSAGASLGGALFPLHAENADELFKKADTALYALKEGGRGGTRLFTEDMLVEAERNASQLSVARGAISESTVIPLYQPKIEIETGRVAGVEALLRWQHPASGLQLPETVEQAFKDYELAAKIGELMREKIVQEVRGWLDAGVDFGRVSINASPAEFLRDDYAEQLLSVLARRKVSPEFIEVEVTEHAFLGRGPEYVARALEMLKKHGTSIALDDFGTGCSSLSHLRDFPVDVVKIDMSFVQQMVDNREIASIVTAVVRLADSLGIDTVAEGVETPAQRDLLRAMGCKIAQGHLFSPAVSAEEVSELFPRRKAAA